MPLDTYSVIPWADIVILTFNASIADAHREASGYLRAKPSRIELPSNTKHRNARIWLALVGTVVAASLPFWPAIGTPLLDSHVGDQLAVSALILTGGGFGITVWQLIRTADASLAASSAVEGLRFRLRTVEDVQLCRECLSLASEIERLHELVATQPTTAAYMILPDRYRNLRLSLSDLRARRSERWSDHERRVIQDAVAKLTDTQRSIGRYIADQSKPMPRVSPLTTSVQTFNCGDRIVVMNECNGLFTDIPITDHAGPGVGCQMVNQFNTCPCDPKPRIVDLSTAAFIALGGNIVSGHFPVTISW